MKAIDLQVREFITDNFLFGQGATSCRMMIRSWKTASSIRPCVLELVTFLENRFPVKISDEELVPDNLDSINNLVNFIESKLKEANQNV